MFQRKENGRLNTMAIIAAGFLGVILVGAILLFLPVSNQEPIEFIDALFMSTSAVCVTGLSTVVPAAQFTLTGKIILLVLIQIGGLGIIACISAFLFLLGRRITLREKVLIQETYNLDQPGGLVQMIRMVLIGTLTVEGVGAVLYSFRFIPKYGVWKGIGHSVFHSVSAFCNAGINLLGDNSFLEFQVDPWINIITMALIILGGVGFTVWFDMGRNFSRVRKHEVPRRWIFTRLSVHTKLVLVMTAVLIVTGTLLVFCMEHNNPDTIGSLSLKDKIMASLFQSVSTRTAGFSTFSQAGMHEETKLVTSILMFIGGSPGGTAGGIKTTTFAMLILTCMTVIRGGKDIECFGRKIPASNIRTGIAVMMVAFGSMLVGILLLAILEPDNILFINIIYEAASAIGTVGLSADLTPQLCRASQCVLMVLMYMGRLGPITLALLFTGKKNVRDQIRELPEENILIG